MFTLNLHILNYLTLFTRGVNRSFLPQYLAEFSEITSFQLYALISKKKLYTPKIWYNASLGHVEAMLDSVYTQFTYFK